MGRAGNGEEDGVGDIVVGQWGHAFVDIFGSSRIPFVADDGEFGFHHSRCDVGDFDIVFQHIRTHASREGVDCMFGGAVNIPARVDFFPGDGSDVHDMSAFLCDHQRGYGPGHVEKSLDIRVDHAFPVVQNAFLQGTDAYGETCVVDQYGDVPPFSFQSFDGLADFPGVAYVERERQYVGSFRADFSGQLFQTFRPAAGDDQIEARFGGFEGCGFANSGGCSGDKCYFLHVSVIFLAKVAISGAKQHAIQGKIDYFRFSFYGYVQRDSD